MIGSRDSPDMKSMAYETHAFLPWVVELSEPYSHVSQPLLALYNAGRCLQHWVTTLKRCNIVLPPDKIHSCVGCGVAQ
eukprot:7021427-Pyramimonas_sp.AAC.1